MMELSHIATNQQRYRLCFKTFEKVINGISDCFQQPNILFHKNTQDVFANLCNQNNYGESISLDVGIEHTDFNWVT